LAKNPGDRCFRVTSELERITLPILRPENLDAGHAIVGDPSKRRDYFPERQYAEPRKQPVPVFEFFARPVFRVVYVKDKQAISIERIDRFNGRAACVEVKTVDHQTDVWPRDLSNYFMRER
jgi:hypothetical protein